MLIKKLSLKNFKQYKEVLIDDFPMGLTGLVGKNGSGKSTIFEAIYYAIFGKSLEGKVPSLRNDHSDGAPLTVILEFEEKGVLYRVMRKVSGRNNSPDAELYVWEEEFNTPHFNAMAFGTTPVNREIFKILKIDADSFKSSFFARQKETAGIISGTSAKRVEAFRKMLGFDKYDDLAERIEEIIKTTKTEVGLMSDYLLGGEVVAQYKKKIKELNSELDTKQKYLETLRNDLAGKKDTKTAISGIVNSLDQKRIRFTELAKLISVDETSIKNSEELLVKYGQAITKLEGLSAEIELECAVVSEFKNISDRIVALNLEKNRKVQHDEIVKSRAKTIVTKDEVNNKLTALMNDVETLPDYAHQIDIKESLLDEKRHHLDTQHEMETELHSSIKSIHDRLKGKQDRLKKVELLDTEGNCPECERPLGEHKPLLVAKYIDEIKSLAEEQQEPHGKLQTLLLQMKEKKDDISTLEFGIKELRKLASEKDKKIALVGQLKEQIEGLKINLEKATEDINALGEINFDQGQLDVAQEALKEIKTRYDKYQKKLGEVASLDSTRTARSEEDLKLLGLREKLENLKSEQNEVGFTEEELRKAKDAFEEISQEVETVNNEIHAIDNVVIESKSQIKQISDSLARNDEYMTKHRKKSKDVELYQIYKDVVNDYKAKMTKRAIPHIAATADKLFTELTGGRYTGFEMNDDLEINVNRDGKSAPLLTLSGGEKDLAAICLRVAISQEIVNMASGGKVGFLAFDEVFGAQDEDRRDLLLQALQRLTDHFKQVFVVSHNGDVEAELPNRISVVKRGHFSVIDRIVMNN